MIELDSKIYKEQKQKENTKKKRDKFNAKKVYIDEYCFDSILEGERYLFLKQMLKIGKIKDLKIHYVYPFEINGILVTSYEADFTYLNENNDLVVEDAKGVKTAKYNINKKLMKAIYNIEIKEVYAEKRKNKSIKK